MAKNESVFCEMKQKHTRKEFLSLYSAKFLDMGPMVMIESNSMTKSYGHESYAICRVWKRKTNIDEE